MLLSAWDLLEPFDNPLPWTHLSQPQTPDNYGNTEGDADGEIRQRDPRACNPKKLSPRERLDKMPSFRLNSNTLDFTLSGPGQEGGKAKVMRAKFQPRFWNFKKDVAVKRLKYDESMDEHEFSKEFVHEVELIAGLSHENVVKLVGFVENLESGQAWMVLSWEPNGNVREFLAKGKCEIPERISLIQDTFEGLKYLHTRQPPICHGDLKSLNILVNSSYRAVITDFGSARVLREPVNRGIACGSARPMIMNGNRTPEEELPRTQFAITGNTLTLTGPAYSLRWAPPDVMMGNRPGLPSDIWSAGWVCWEVMTDKLPFPQLTKGESIILTVIRGQLPTTKEDERLSQIVRLCSLMADCWSLDPRDRPSVSWCCDEVKWVPSLPPSSEAPSNSLVRNRRVLLQMGRMHFLHSRYKDAALLFHQVRKQSTQHDSETAEASYWLGSIFTVLSKFGEAEKAYTGAKHTYAHLADELGQANALQGVGGVYHRQYKLAEAKQALIRAQSIYDKLGEDRGRANTLCELGNVYRAQSNSEQAEKSFIEAQEIYTRIGDRHGQANVLQGLGSFYRLQFKFDEAENFFDQAQQIYTRVGDNVGLAIVLLEQGGMSCARSEYAQAEPLFDRALEVSTKISNAQGQANALCGVGDVYRHRSEYTEAERCYTQAQDTYDRIGDGVGQAKAFFGLGEVYRHQSEDTKAAASYAQAADGFHRFSKYTEAESCYTQAQDAYARIGKRDYQAHTLCDLGRLYCDRSKYAQAASSYIWAAEIYHSRSGPATFWYRKAQSACARIKDSESQLNMSCMLGEIYRDRSKFYLAALCDMQAGRIYHSRSEYAEAERCYDHAQDAYNRVDEDVERANALSGLGEVSRHQNKRTQAASSYTRAGDLYYSKSKYTEAASSYIEAEKAYAYTLNEEGQAKVLFALGEVYRHQSEYFEARTCYDRANSLFARLRNCEGQANALYGLGEVGRHQFRFVKAENYFDHEKIPWRYCTWEVESYYAQARELYARVSNDEGQVKTLFWLGEFYRDQSKDAEAETCYIQAENLYTRMGNGEGQANALYGLGEAYRNQSKHAEAETCYNQANELYTSIGHGEGRAKALFGLGKVYGGQSKCRKAVTCYTQAGDIYDGTNNHEGLADVLYWLGEVYRLQFCPEAEHHYILAEAFYHRVGNCDGRSKSLYRLGEVYRNRSMHSRAALCYIRAGDFYRILLKDNQATESYEQAKKAHARCLDAKRPPNVWDGPSPACPIGPRSAEQLNLRLAPIWKHQPCWTYRAQPEMVRRMVTVDLKDDSQTGRSTFVPDLPRPQMFP